MVWPVTEYVYGRRCSAGILALNKDYDKSENHLKAIQSTGQIIGEVMGQPAAYSALTRATTPTELCLGMITSAPDAFACAYCSQPPLRPRLCMSGLAYAR